MPLAVQVAERGDELARIFAPPPLSSLDPRTAPPPDFVAAVRERRAPFIPFEECARITEVVLRAREAMETGRPQRV